MNTTRSLENKFGPINEDLITSKKQYSLSLLGSSRSREISATSSIPTGSKLDELILFDYTPPVRRRGEEKAEYELEFGSRLKETKLPPIGTEFTTINNITVSPNAITPSFGYQPIVISNKSTSSLIQRNISEGDNLNIYNPDRVMGVFPTRPKKEKVISVPEEEVPRTKKGAFGR